MWYFKEESENGDFQDKDGKVYILTECYRVIAPDGRCNAELGYTEFENMEECIRAWELTEVKEEMK